MSENQTFNTEPAGRGAPLPMWVVYDHPADHPDSFLAREWHAVAGVPLPIRTDNILSAPTLEALRQLLPAHLTRMPRSQQDDPVIVEVWL